MPARSEWKGFLQVHQLQVPVKAFSAGYSASDITLNQLHRECGERIRQQRYCPRHGPVEPDAIVPGYQVADGCYLPLDPAEIEQLRPASNKTLTVECFISDDTIDPVFHSGRTLYLVPDGPPGQRPFAVLREGMRARHRHAFSRVVMSGRELLVLLRPYGRLLAMTVVEYSHRVRPAADYESEVADIAPGSREVELVQQLVEALTDSRFELSRYRDRYSDDLHTLIEQRVAAADLTAMIPEPMAEPDRQTSDEAMVAQLEASLLAAGIPAGLSSRLGDGASAEPVGRLPAERQEESHNKLTA